MFKRYCTVVCNETKQIKRHQRRTCPASCWDPSCGSRRWVGRNPLDCTSLGLRFRRRTPGTFPCLWAAPTPARTLDLSNIKVQSVICSVRIINYNGIPCKWDAQHKRTFGWQPEGKMRKGAPAF